MFVLVAGVCSLFAQSRPPALMSGLGQHHHTISTKSPEAQRFFDQGLTLVFAFNPEEAARAFRRASELDPQSAMAFGVWHWHWVHASIWMSIPFTNGPHM